MPSVTAASDMRWICTFFPNLSQPLIKQLSLWMRLFLFSMLFYQSVSAPVSACLDFFPSYSSSLSRIHDAFNSLGYYWLVSLSAWPYLQRHSLTLRLFCISLFILFLLYKGILCFHAPLSQITPTRQTSLISLPKPMIPLFLFDHNKSYLTLDWLFHLH